MSESYTSRPRCKCGHAIFKSEDEARRCLERNNNTSRDGRWYGATAIYWSGKCRSWHLTSKSRKPYKTGKTRRK